MKASSEGSAGVATLLCVSRRSFGVSLDARLSHQTHATTPSAGRASAASAHNVTGINLDFEPYGDASLTNADGVVYTYFVEYLALTLHRLARKS